MLFCTCKIPQQSQSYMGVARVHPQRQVSHALGGGQEETLPRLISLGRVRPDRPKALAKPLGYGLRVKLIIKIFVGFVTVDSILHGVGHRPAPWRVLPSFKAKQPQVQAHAPLVVAHGLWSGRTCCPRVLGKTLNCCFPQPQERAPPRSVLSKTLNCCFPQPQERAPPRSVLSKQLLS